MRALAVLAIAVPAAAFFLWRTWVELQGDLRWKALSFVIGSAGATTAGAFLMGRSPELILLIFAGAYGGMIIGSGGKIGLIFEVAYGEDDLTEGESFWFQVRVVSCLLLAAGGVVAAAGWLT